MFSLAVPVVLAELGWMTMGLVDTLMVGPIGPEAIGAVGIGSSLFMAVCIFAMGLLLGLDTLVSQAFGAGRLDECHKWLAHGVVLSLLLSVPITLLVLGLASSLGALGLHPDVLASRPTVSDHSRLEHPAAARVCLVQAVSPGHGRRAAGDDRARDGQHPERVRQLGADLRSPRRARDGRARLGVGDRLGPGRDVRLSVRGDSAPRARPPAGTLRDAAPDRVDAHAPARSRWDCPRPAR